MRRRVTGLALCQTFALHRMRQAGRKTTVPVMGEGLTYEGIIDPRIHPLILFSTEEIGDQLPACVLEALSDWSTWL